MSPNNPIHFYKKAKTIINQLDELHFEIIKMQFDCDLKKENPEQLNELNKKYYILQQDLNNIIEEMTNIMYNDSDTHTKKINTTDLLDYIK